MSIMGTQTPEGYSLSFPRDCSLTAKNRQAWNFRSNKNERHTRYTGSNSAFPEHEAKLLILKQREGIMPKGKPKRLYPQLYKRGKYIGWEKKLAITRTPAPEPLPPVVHKGNLAALCKTLNEYLDKVKPKELAAMLSKDPMDQWREGLISDVEALTKLTASVTEVIASMEAREKMDTEALFQDEPAAPAYEKILENSD